MPWVIAIMVALTVIAAAAGLALRNVAVHASAELTGGITVQIVEAAPARRDREVRATTKLLQSLPGVRNVRAVPQHELDALIAPWLGDAGSDASAGTGAGDDATADDEVAVPVPGLIDARLEGAVSPERLHDLRERLRGVAPAAQVDAQAGWLGPVFQAIASLQWLALALIALLTTAMAAAVLLATRTALVNHRATIEIVHMLGGTDLQIARIFQRAIALDAGLGAVAGLAAAVIAVLLLGGSFAGLGAGLVDGGALRVLDWALLALVPAVAVLLAMATARISVLRALRTML
jgi:cell division transport system permease protein